MAEDTSKSNNIKKAIFVDIYKETRFNSDDITRDTKVITVKYHVQDSDIEHKFECNSMDEACLKLDFINVDIDGLALVTLYDEYLGFINNYLYNEFKRCVIEGFF